MQESNSDTPSDGYQLVLFRVIDGIFVYIYEVMLKCFSPAVWLLAEYLGPGGEAWVVKECLDLLERQSKGEKGVAFRSFEIPKKSGGKRLILVPVDKLMALLRLIKDELIDKAPLGRSPHGFRRRRSSVTNARRHLESGAKFCLNVDIKDCFPSTPVWRIRKILDSAIGTTMRAEGHSDEMVSDILDILCTLMTFRYGRTPGPSLPVGTPTSPSVLNLVLRPFDERLLRKLKAITKKTGQRFTYTRYGDDISVSSPDPLPKNLAQIIADMLHHFGFKPNTAKTKWMSLHGSGPAIEVTGIIISDGRLLLPDQWIKETEELLLRFIYKPQANPKHRKKTARKLRGKLSLCRMIYDRGYPARIAGCIKSLNDDPNPLVKRGLAELSRTKESPEETSCELAINDSELEEAEHELAGDENYFPLDDLDEGEEDFSLVQY